MEIKNDSSFYKSTARSSNSRHKYSSSDKGKQTRVMFFSHLRPHLTIISVLGPRAKQHAAHSKHPPPPKQLFSATAAADAALVFHSVSGLV